MAKIALPLTALAVASFVGFRVPWVYAPLFVVGIAITLITWSWFLGAEARAAKRRRRALRQALEARPDLRAIFDDGFLTVLGTNTPRYLSLTFDPGDAAPSSQLWSTLAALTPDTRAAFVKRARPIVDHPNVTALGLHAAAVTIAVTVDDEAPDVDLVALATSAQTLLSELGSRTSETPPALDAAVALVAAESDPGWATALLRALANGDRDASAAALRAAHTIDVDHRYIEVARLAAELRGDNDAIQLLDERLRSNAGALSVANTSGGGLSEAASS